MSLKKLPAAAMLAGATLAAQPSSAQDITLEFVVWNYALDTIQDNVRRFEEANPGIKVNVTDYTWPDYQDSLVLRFRGGTQTDVLYGGQDWLPAWASAGWIAPLDKIVPEAMIDTLSGEMAGFALSDVTYEDQVYGLPYYADTISFLYNSEILEEHSIEVPETWEDVTAAAEKLKAAGMDRPIVYEYNQELPNFFDAFVAQVYGRGGDLFDEDLNAVFNQPDNAAYQHLEWLRDAFEKELVQPENHESNIITTMNTGQHAFTIVYNYVLAAMNNKAEQPLAGQFSLAPMPGEAHSTLGFAKFYAVTATTADDPERAEAAWKFVEFMAGQPYDVAKRWAVEHGLGFGQLPLLEDQEVREAWGEWVDMDVLSNQIENARAGTWTEWTAVWSAFFRPLLASAMVGEISVEQAMNDGAERWNTLREQFANR
ncbi:sugar ABC transporter substrate-binding protein [Chelativorans sp. M5D2P16]|uniref:ABC transporter substrate-binding protein n=1 Tax=Chelativorans sp. M5D2P16 TaxID=3095678 RepID=UPI002ACA4177|nr:sugar ABC transporter substrate-binding protein [Chelativorans sp. M5D2P16]MDZ5696102.1 sugar ABC transporter substrate-binding protein [Chelativorans sp. M5D2P16]